MNIVLKTSKIVLPADWPLAGLQKETYASLRKQEKSEKCTILLPVSSLPPFTLVKYLELKCMMTNWSKSLAVGVLSE